MATEKNINCGPVASSSCQPNAIRSDNQSSGYYHAGNPSSSHHTTTQVVSRSDTESSDHYCAPHPCPPPISVLNNICEDVEHTPSGIPRCPSQPALSPVLRNLAIPPPPFDSPTSFWLPAFRVPEKEYRVPFPAAPLSRYTTGRADYEDRDVARYTPVRSSSQPCKFDRQKVQVKMSARMQGLVDEFNDREQIHCVYEGCEEVRYTHAQLDRHLLMDHGVRLDIEPDDD